SVINHSVGWVFFGPGDGTSVYSNSPLAAVDRAVNAGIVWANAAGNEGGSTWTGSFNDADSDGYLEFQGADETQAVELYAGSSATIVARWSDSWSAAATDVDLYLMDSQNNIVAKGDTTQSGQAGDEPLEVFDYSAPIDNTYYLELVYKSGPVPAWLEVQ